MMGMSMFPSVGNLLPSSIPNLVLWIDAETNISGLQGGALDSVGDRSSAAHNLSNTANVGSRPAWDLATTNSFQNITKHAINFETGGDWLTLSGLDTATPFTLPGVLSTWHTSKHTATNTAPFTTGNTPYNIIGTTGVVNTIRTAVGFSAGSARYITWEGAAYVTYNSTATTLNDGNPHTICWVHQGVTLKCYVDGVLDSTQTTGVYQNTNGFNGIGAGTGNTDGLVGNLAEVAVWNAALTANQVAQLHVRSRSLWF